MKLAGAREHYYTFSGKTSDVARQLAFAGIAVVWIFRAVDHGTSVLPRQLLIAAAWLIGALGCDFLQYVSSTISWGWFHRVKEQNTPEDTDFKAPRLLNWPGLAFFGLKVVAMCVAYVILLSFLIDHVRAA